MKNIFLTLFFVFFSANAFSADVTIEMLNKNKETKKRMVYSQELVKIDIGKVYRNGYDQQIKDTMLKCWLVQMAYDLPSKN